MKFYNWLTYTAPVRVNVKTKHISGGSLTIGNLVNLPTKVVESLKHDLVWDLGEKVKTLIEKQLNIDIKDYYIHIHPWPAHEEYSPYITLTKRQIEGCNEIS